jgi:hypothetical protein
VRDLVATVLAMTLGLSGVAAAITPTETVIHRNVKGYIGEGVAVSRNGVVYGYAQYAFPGGKGVGNGVIYRLVKPKAGHSGYWYNSYVLAFAGGVGGSEPVGKPVFDGHDNMYGVTGWGGEYRQGLVFGLTETAPGSGTWNSAVLHHFGPSDGGGTQSLGASLIVGANGVLYGTTVSTSLGSGVCLGSCGWVFSLTPPAAGQSNWTYQTLYAFQGGSDGDYPAAPLVQDATGALYGSTQFGGSGNTTCPNSRGCGTIFMLTPPAQGQSTWDKTTLYNFVATQDAEGAQPAGALTLSGSGTVYGTAKYDGSDESAGIAFMLTPPVSGQSNWAYSVIHQFNGATDGIFPNGGLILGADGTLLGTTSLGGSGGSGAVFRLIPPKQIGSSWTSTVLHSFPPATLDGAEPNGPLTRDALGDLFGTTQDGGSPHAGTGYGTTFEITP